MLKSSGHFFVLVINSFLNSDVYPFLSKGLLHLVLISLAKNELL